MVVVVVVVVVVSLETFSQSGTHNHTQLAKKDIPSCWMGRRAAASYRMYEESVWMQRCGGGGAASGGALGGRSSTC